MNRTRLTVDPSLDTTQIWRPHGKQIGFVSNLNLGFRVYLKNGDGFGSEEEVADLGSNLQVNPWVRTWGGVMQTHFVTGARTIELHN